MSDNGNNSINGKGVHITVQGYRIHSLKYYCKAHAIHGHPALDIA